LLSFPLICLLILIHRVVSKKLALAISFLAGILYLINWGTYLIIGEFIGLEGARFAVYNFEHILWHMAQISLWYIIALLILVLSPFLLYGTSHKTKVGFPEDILTTGTTAKTILQIVIAVIVLSSAFVFLRFENFPERIKAALRLFISPQLSLLFDRPGKTSPVTLGHGMRELNTQLIEQESWEQYLKKSDDKHPDHPVLVIVVESLRSDVLNDNTIMPNLYELKTRSLSFKAYAPSNVTHYAWPSIFTAQYPLRSDYNYYYPSRAPYPRVAIYDILKKKGYRTAIFSAQNEKWCGMTNSFNKKSLDLFYSAEVALQAQHYVSKEDRIFTYFVKLFRLTGKLDDSLVAEKAIAWMSQAKSSKFFVGINFQRSHFPYTWPDTFQAPFPHGAPQRWFYPIHQLHNMRNRYFNALHYTDYQIGRMIQFLKESGLYEQSLIIVTGDHGQSFHEHGSTCHANTLYNETALTPVVIKTPQGAPELTVRKSPELIDLAPSILDILGLPPHASFQGQSLFAPNPIQKPIFITVHSPIAKQDAVVVDDWKLIKDHRSNQIKLFDLKNDPAELNNLASTYHLDAQWLLYLLMTWRHNQLEYYSNTYKQKKFYPPKFSIDE
jgi:arylsulfatase A-like enzyme